MAPGRPSLVIKSGKSSTRNISVPTLLLSGVNIVSCTLHHSKSIYRIPDLAQHSMGCAALYNIYPFI